MADELLVGVSDDESVFGGVVFVLVLSDQTGASIVVGLALSSAPVLGLESLEIWGALNEFDESHFNLLKRFKIFLCTKTF